MGTAVGPAGVQLKMRCNRGGQTFEFPVLLTREWDDLRLVAATSLLPPLTGIILIRLVWRPLARWQRQRRAAAEQRGNLEAAQLAHAKAARETALLAPVAARKAAAEAGEDGLVILRAVYGLLEEWRAAGGAALRSPAAADAAAAAGSGGGQRTQTFSPDVLGQAGPSDQAAGLPQQPAAAAAAGWPGGGAPSAGQPPTGAAAAASSSSSSSSAPPPGTGAAADPSQAGGAAAGPAAAAAAAAAGQELGAAASSAQRPPPRWVDVTAALQYLVVGGKLELYSGVPKQGLMGFADVAPGSDAERRLYVVYSYKRQLWEKEVGEADALRLPGAGAVVKEAALVAQLAGELSALKAGR